MAERPGLLKTVSAVFVFLAAFLAVASYLGGGTAGLTWAGLIAVVVVAIYLLFFGWIAQRPVVRRMLEPERPPGLASGKRPRPRLEPPKPDLTAMRVRGARNVCGPGPYEVEPGRTTKIPLGVERGFTLIGTLEERDGDDFEFVIVDEDNWVKYQQGKRYDVQDDGDSEGVYKISWKVPSGGPWFMVLEAYGKQLVREVSVNLRLSGGP